MICWGRSCRGASADIQRPYGLASGRSMSIVARRPVACLVGFAMLAAPTMMLPSAQPVHAHSWYPDRCCSGKDCRKVDRIEFLPDGGMRMRAGPMEVLVPRHFVQELSNDADAHICAVSITEGKYEPVCVFMPGTT